MKYNIVYYTLLDCKNSINIETDNIHEFMKEFSKREDFYKVFSISPILNCENEEG